MRRLKNKKVTVTVIVALLFCLVVFLAWPNQTSAPARQSVSLNNTTQNPPSSPAEFNKSQYPTDTASSLWVVVNKGRQLPGDYAPANLVAPNVPLRLSPGSPEMHLRSDAASALEQMFASAKQQDIQLRLESGYRSYSEQVSVYNGYVASSGQTQADTFSARPGHSEHQTGLAADIEPLDRTCEVDQCFESTPEGKWLAANSYKFGFVIRYQKDTQNLTGYEYEPWHVRYVGSGLAAQLHQSNMTLEQFFNLPVYVNYPAQSLIIKDS